MFLSVLSILALAPTMVITAFQQIDFPSAKSQPITITHARQRHISGSAGLHKDASISLPSRPPTLTVTGSRLSPMLRARDVLDIAGYPPRAVAKLFQLDAAGSRTGTACTAQFVSPRYLVSAAHCIVDISNGTARAGFEVAAAYDNGKSPFPLAKVVRAWIGPGSVRPADDATGRSELVTADHCTDYAVLEIDRPLGDDVGWLGMTDRTPPANPTADARLLYRFSYPNLSNAVGLAAQLKQPNLPAVVRTALTDALTDAELKEPDFSPTNLYFEYGTADRAEGLVISDSTGFTLPGRSGSALLDRNADIVAIMSRGYSGKLYSCRMTSTEIGAVAAIIANDRAKS